MNSLGRDRRVGVEHLLSQKSLWLRGRSRQCQGHLARSTEPLGYRPKSLPRVARRDAEAVGVAKRRVESGILRSVVVAIGAVELLGKRPRRAGDVADALARGPLLFERREGRVRLKARQRNVGFGRRMLWTRQRETR
jgi:hypothetical protein